MFMISYGILDELVAPIIIMYEDTTAKVITPDGEKEHLKILAGVLQWNSLASYIFVIFIDYFMRIALIGKEYNLVFQLRKREIRSVSPTTFTYMYS